MKTIWLSLVVIAVFISSFCGNAYGLAPYTIENDDYLFTYNNSSFAPYVRARYAFKTPLIYLNGIGYYGAYSQYEASVLIGFTDGSTATHPNGRIISSGYVAPVGKAIAYVEFHHYLKDYTASISSGVGDLIRCDEATDSDNDGLSNLAEFNALTGYFNPDTDDDGVNDGTEVAAGRNPLQSDLWYHLTVLGDGVTPTAVNIQGHVAGYFNAPEGTRAFIQIGGVRTTLGTFSGGSCSMAYDMNDNDVVVGWSNSGSNYRDQACAWNNGVIQDLGALCYYSGIKGSDAISINNNGTIAVQTWGETRRMTAYGYRTTSYAYPYLIKNGQGYNMGTLNGQITYPKCINNNETMVGNNPQQGFVYENTTMTAAPEFLFIDRINDRGDMTGWAAGRFAAFLSADSLNDPENLGSFGGGWTYVRGLNNNAVIVGHSQNASGRDRAFVRIPGTPIQDLNNCVYPGELPAGFILNSANDINDLGSIVGTMANPITGQQMGFMLTTIR
jgi:uncharacterized membrane protein